MSWSWKWVAAIAVFKLKNIYISEKKLKNTTLKDWKQQRILAARIPNLIERFSWKNKKVTDLSQPSTNTQDCAQHMWPSDSILLNSCIDSFCQWRILWKWVWNCSKAISCGWLFVCCLPVVSCFSCLITVILDTASREMSVYSQLL